MKTKTKRKIDQVAEKNYSKLGKKYSLVGKGQMKRLEFLIITAFVLGVVGAVAWGFKNNLYSGSEAAGRKTTSDTITVNRYCGSANGGTFDTLTYLSPNLCSTGYAPYSFAMEGSKATWGCSSRTKSNSATACSAIVNNACSGITASISYNGDTYKTTAIGSQCWFAENLRTSKKPDGTPLVKGTDYICYEGTTSDPDCDSPNALADLNGLKYGPLYTWKAATNGAAAVSEGAGPQGICPTGWHIPTDKELYILENYLKDPGAICDPNRISGEGSCEGAGGKLLYSTDDSSSGFNFALAGFYNGSAIKSRAVTGGFWSATDGLSSQYYWFRTLSFGFHNIQRSYYFPPFDVLNKITYKISVRCVRN